MAGTTQGTGPGAPMKAPQVGEELLLRTPTGLLQSLVAVYVDEQRVDLAHNRYSRPVWSTTLRGLAKAVARVSGLPMAGAS